MHGPKATVGVLTASRQALTEAHFANCATPMDAVRIRGMEGKPEFWEPSSKASATDFLHGPP